MCVAMTSPGLACVTGLRIQHTRPDAVHGRCRCTAPWPGAAEHCTHGIQPCGVPVTLSTMDRGLHQPTGQHLSSCA